MIIAFSVLGLLALAYISFFSGTERTHIADLSSTTGETVEVRCTVIGAFHHSNGLTESLVHEEGALLYLDIERSSREFSPGDVVTVRGQPYVWDESVRMSVSTDRTMGIERGGSPLNYTDADVGSICSIKGVVISTEWYGRSGTNLSLESLDAEGKRFSVWVLSLKNDEEPSIGDGIEVTGLRTSSGGVICFGPSSIVFMYKASPMDTTLSELIGSAPGSVPRDPLTFECYLRYTPTGRSLFVGESSEGARVSLKAFLEDPATGLQRGDRVRLVNCSLEWDPAGMRYNVRPSTIVLVEPHGPWTLSIGSLPYGIGDFEGCSVNLTGAISSGIDGLYLIDGNSTLSVRGGGPSDPAEGIIAFDINQSIYFLDRERSP